MVQMYLDDFRDKIDSLILGCTHYPLLKETISSIYPDIKIVDPAKETAQDLKEILVKKNLLKNDAEKGHEVESLGFTKNRSVKYEKVKRKEKCKFTLSL